MRIVRGLESYPPDALSSAVALGAFDGVHLGHRAILGTAVAQARREGPVAPACPFHPHPPQGLPPQRSPLPITTLQERPAPVPRGGVQPPLGLGVTPARRPREGGEPPPR